MFDSWYKKTDAGRVLTTARWAGYTCLTIFGLTRGSRSFSKHIQVIFNTDLSDSWTQNRKQKVLLKACWSFKKKGLVSYFNALLVNSPSQPITNNHSCEAKKSGEKSSQEKDFGSFLWLADICNHTTIKNRHIYKKRLFKTVDLEWFHLHFL